MRTFVSSQSWLHASLEPCRRTLFHSSFHFLEGNRTIFGEVLEQTRKPAERAMGFLSQQEIPMLVELEDDAVTFSQPQPVPNFPGNCDLAFRSVLLAIASPYKRRV